MTGWTWLTTLGLRPLRFGNDLFASVILSAEDRIIFFKLPVDDERAHCDIGTFNEAEAMGGSMSCNYQTSRPYC